MQITPRAVVFAAFGVGPLLLAAGCGGTSATGAQATIARIQPTSFVEIAPATTTTTTTLPPNFTPEAGTRSPVEQTYTIKAGDDLIVDPGAGTVTNTTQDRTLACDPIPPHLMAMIEDGGLLPHLKKRLQGEAA